MNFLATYVKRLLQHRQYSPREQIADLRMGKIRDDQCELVAVDPGQRDLFLIHARQSRQIAFPCVLLQGGRKSRQERVADFRTLGIVDLLESVQAEQQQRTLTGLLAGARQGLCIPFHEQAAIRQARECIEVQQAILVRLGG